MMIIGVDYHPSDQYTAFADTETGECGERRLNATVSSGPRPLRTKLKTLIRMDRAGTLSWLTSAPHHSI